MSANGRRHWLLLRIRGTLHLQMVSQQQQDQQQSRQRGVSQAP